MTELTDVQLVLKQSNTANAIPDTSELVTGELAWNAVDGKLFGLQSTGPSSNQIIEIGKQLGEGIYNKYEEASDGAKVNYTIPYTVGYIDVYVAGELLPRTAYTATDGLSITLHAAPSLNDIVIFIAWLIKSPVAQAGVYKSALRYLSGGNTTVTVEPFNPNYIDIFKNGIRLIPQDYTVEDANAGTFTVVNGKNNDEIMTLIWTVTAIAEKIVWTYRPVSGIATHYASHMDYIIADTSTGNITVLLPATPELYDKIGILDAKGTFGSTGVTIEPNGNEIMGNTNDYLLSTNNQHIELLYLGSDWRIIND